MVIARKIAYNVVVSTVAKVLSTILALVSIGFITRYLGKEGFGNYATVLAFLSFFAAVSDLGLYYITTREISRAGADEEKILGNIFSIRLLSSLAIFLISPIVTLFFSYPKEVNEGIIIVAASFLFSSSYQILNGVFQKNLAMDKVAVGELIGKIVQVAVVITAVKMQLGFAWIISSLLFNMFASFLIVFFWAKKYVRIHLRFDFDYWKLFLKESMPMGVATIITFAYFKMDTILLSVMKTGSDVGIYNAAYKVLENITFFPAMIAGLVMPILAHSIFINRDRFEEISNKTFKVFVILVVPLVVGVLFLADDVIRLIGGAGFVESGQVLRILVFALAFIFFGQFFNTLLIVGNLQKRLMWTLGIAAVANITLNLIFIPKFSYTAAAYISAITEFIVVLLTAYMTMKKLKYKPSLAKTPVIVLAGVVMAVPLFVFKGYNFFVLAIGSSIIYFIALWLFKAIETSEITSLISKKGVQEYDELP
ncbi:MAG: Polysaccharide biosynthesis protein [Candidatus Moranbacteria bacterium GW2011_GWA2_39_41]|nr:MAG: Polysaccharide biosynthesis protein [Candidatus Moranbacteria bacterium GW2011_GWA2_39_41]